jgi:hypothetical protein
MNSYFQTLMRLGLLAGLFFIASCSDEPNTPSVGGNYVLQTEVRNTQGQANNYIQTLPNLGSAEINNANAVEIANSFGYVSGYNGAAYYHSFLTPSLTKFENDASGRLRQTGVLSLSAEVFTVFPTFQSPTVGFISGYAAPRVIMFNPTTMARTGVVEMPNLIRNGQPSEIVGDTVPIRLSYVSETLLRGNQLFCALHYESASNRTGSNAADMVILDLSRVNVNGTNDSSVILRRLRDTRGAMIGSSSNGGSRYMKLDETGDIYALCHNSWTLTPNTGKPACVLRIRSNQTTFDTSYYFNVQQACGNRQVMALEYVGNGIAYVNAVYPEQIPANGSPFSAACFKWWRVDLRNQTATEVPDLPFTAAFGTSMTYTENNLVYFPISNNTNQFSYWEFNPTTNRAAQKFTTQGRPYLVRF